MPKMIQIRHADASVGSNVSLRAPADERPEQRVLDDSETAQAPGHRARVELV